MIKKNYDIYNKLVMKGCRKFFLALSCLYFNGVEVFLGILASELPIEKFRKLENIELL